MVSPPGELVGQGLTFVTTNQADFSVSIPTGWPSGVRAHGFGYDFIFSGPNANIPGIASYSNATKWPNIGSATAGMYIATNAATCTNICGNFQILEFHATSNAVIDHFWIKFSQVCECGSAPALSGELRYNSQLAPSTPLPHTWHVPAEFPTIQDAMDNASIYAGDTILVGPGIYNESVYFGGKRVRLISSDGPGQTAIVAPPIYGGPAVTMDGGVNSNALLCGFTISNSDLGVLIALGCSPVICSNLILDCGSGIDCLGSPIVRNNFIKDYYGATVRIWGGEAPVFESNVIEGGRAIEQFNGGHPIIRNNIIRFTGGEGFYGDGDPDIIQNLIVGNGYFAVQYFNDPNTRGPSLIQNTIVNGTGWAVAINGNNVAVVNNIIVSAEPLNAVSGTVAGNDLFPSNSIAALYIGQNGNISVDPAFAFAPSQDFHLLPDSPCVNAGVNTNIMTATDLDGRPRVNGSAIDMGAFEFQAAHYVAAGAGNPVFPYTNWATAALTIQDAIDAATPGEPVIVSNGVYNIGANIGLDGQSSRLSVTNALTLRSVSGAASTIIDGGNSGRCATLADGAALVGFTLQNGFATNGGGLLGASTNAFAQSCILSQNNSLIAGSGAYTCSLLDCALTDNLSAAPTVIGNAAYGSYISNCVVSHNDGSAVSTIDASTLISCVVNSNSATAILSSTADNCTFAANTNGGARNSVLRSCVLTGNIATSGGGAASSILTNCLLVANVAAQEGGGAADGSVLANCTVVANSSGQTGTGGAGPSCQVFNSIIYFNTNGNYTGNGASYSCITPLPAGFGNFTNDPAFADPANDWSLQSNSPCINSGDNSVLLRPSFPLSLIYHAWANPFYDLTGNVRLVGDTVDVGAYEFQSPVSAISYAWLFKHGLPTDGSTDYLDSDGDGASNWEEWRAGTDPFDPSSNLNILSIKYSDLGRTITWRTVVGKKYFIRYYLPDRYIPFRPLYSNIPGQEGTTSFTDTNQISNGQMFYRLGVQ